MAAPQASGLGELIAWVTRPNGPAVRYASAELPLKLLLEAAGRGNVAVFLLDGDLLNSAAELHDALAASGGFPAYYGRNWDALLDCWSDFSWRPAAGYLCVTRSAASLRARLPQEAEVLEQVAEDTAERFRASGDSRFFKLLMLG